VVTVLGWEESGIIRSWNEDEFNCSMVAARRSRGMGGQQKRGVKGGERSQRSEMLVRVGEIKWQSSELGRASCSGSTAWRARSVTRG
jgi:hypothetical protein